MPAYLTRGAAAGSARALGPRKTLRAIHPPPTSASSAPTIDPAIEKGPATSGACTWALRERGLPAQERAPTGPPVEG
jgi:hypothetical protein